MKKVKTLPAADHDKHNLSQYPNMSATGSTIGMRQKYYGKDALLVKCGKYIYNVTASPEIYKAAIMLLFILVLNFGSKAQTITPRQPNAKQTANGNFIAIKKEPAPGVPTGKAILHTDGKSYPVLQSAKGKLYYIVLNKKGNPSKKYINL